MTDEFNLAVKYKGINLSLQTRPVFIGDRKLFRVQMDETDVYFEPDAEKNYEEVLMPGQNERLLLRIDTELLIEIGIRLKAVLR